MNNNHYESGVNEEQEVAQLNSIISNQNAVSSVQKKLAEQRKFESLMECAECGEEIPEARRQAIKGCTMCIHCQQLEERRARGL
jgi:phage/conjugal plasmid C-4 type zinc finger TraR family protein